MTHALYDVTIATQYEEIDMTALERIKDNGAGIALCLAIALPAWLLGRQFDIIGGPVFAILIGMAAAAMLRSRDTSAFAPGIAYTSKKVLQYAVILLGFGLNLAQIAQVGATSLPIIISTITTSLVIAFVLSRALKIPAKISTLVGVGSSICGGSAIAATAPVIDADDEEIAQAISVIFLFNIVAALIVDRESHKPIVIGEHGAKLREIGRLARADVAKLLDKRVHLEIWVRVRKGWSDDARVLKSLGYE